jgi:hypothetical protein
MPEIKEDSDEDPDKECTDDEIMLSPKEISV